MFRESSDINNETDDKPSESALSRTKSSNNDCHAMPQIDPELGFRICVIVYKRFGCYGDSCSMSPGTTNDLSDIKPCGNFLNRILSLEIGRGCRVKVCSGKSLSGVCHVYHATYANISRYIPYLSRSVHSELESLECTCS